MKKRIFLLLTAVLLAAGCGKQEINETPEIKTSGESIENVSAETTEEKEEKEEKEIAEEKFDFAELNNLEFYFASGAGGWRTVMQIENDGSFSGTFSDSDMGSTGEGYPSGTMYFCDFAGKFTQPVKVNDYTYTMKIEEISYANEADTEEIKEEILYQYTTPYGLEGLKRYCFIYLEHRQGNFRRNI